ncbi:hypothetical protein Tco_0585767, partial [Tanacetum coccineum]
TKDLDTYDSDCDDISNAKAVLMANISNYGSDVISEVPHFETYLNDMENQSVRAMQDLHMLTNPQAFYDNIDKQALGYQNPFYLKKAQWIKPTLYDGIVISDKHVAMHVIDDEETLILEEESRSKMSEKEKDLEAIKQNISHKPIDYEKLNRLSEDIGKCFTPQQELSAEQAFGCVYPILPIRTTPNSCTEGDWGFEHTKAVFNNEIISFLKSLKDIFNVFDKDLLNEIMEVQTVFAQMDAAVQQSLVGKQCLEIAKKELLLENDRLLQQIMSQVVLLTVINSMSFFGESVNLDRKRNESCDKCFNLEAELLKSQNAHNDQIFQKRKSCDNQNALEIPNLFENNDLKAQLQDKDTTICKLKEIIKSMREKSREENVNYNYCEIENKNVELENSVAKLVLENERLCKEINHVKQVFKEQYDSIKKTRVRTKEQSDSLYDKLNLKSAENEDLKAQIQDKLDLEPLAPRLLQNREAHIDYLKYTQEQADILQGIVEQAKAKQPLDKELDFACKHAQRIQELLVYVQDTCPNAIKLNEKKVVVTPKNKVKKVRFVEPLTSSRNIKQVESYTTSDSDTHVLSPTGLKCSTSNCGSKPTDVKHSLLNVNSICATCMKSMFDGVHDMCLLDFAENEYSGTFTIVGNSCPLPRITSANVVPPKKTTSYLVETPKPELKVYSKKPKNVKNVGSSKKAKIIESKNANHLEPNHTWGSNPTDFSSSSLFMTCCPNCSLVSGLQLFETYDKEPLSAHELCYSRNGCSSAIILDDSPVSTSIDHDCSYKLGVVGPEDEGLPWMLDDSYVQEDEVFLAKEQPLPDAASPTAQSPDYIPESDPEADPEENNDEDPEEDLVDYPVDRVDDSDDEDESSEDDEDDDVDIEADDDEEEEEHPAPTDSIVVALPAAYQAPSTKETEPFKTDKFAATPPPHPAYRVIARICIPALVPTPVWSDVEVARLLAISTPPSSPLSLCPICRLGYRAAMIWLRAEVASTSHLLPLPPPITLSHTRPDAPSSGTPPLHLLFTDHREDRPNVTLPPRKRLGITLGPTYKVRESSSAATRLAGGLRADYGFVATMDRQIRRDLEKDVGYGITDS